MGKDAFQRLSTAMAVTVCVIFRPWYIVRPEGITKMPFRDFQRPWLSQFASSLAHQIVQKMYSALTGPRKLRSFIPNMQPESSILLCLAIIQRHWFAWCVFHGIVKPWRYALFAAAQVRSR